MRQNRYFVSGKVQGVGFRNYTAKKANSVGVIGWVRNLDDGRVEVCAAGTDEQFREFEIFLFRGPLLAEVRDVDVIQEKLDFEGTTFDILT